MPSASPAPTGIAWVAGGSPTPRPTDPVTAAILDGPGLGEPPSDGTDGATGSVGGSTGGGTAGSAGGSTGGGTGGGHGGGWGPLTSALAITGLTGPSITGVGLVPTLVTTTGAVTAVMALSLFGRRRRDDDLPDDALSAAAGRGVAVAELQPGLAAVALGELAEIPDMESLLPRWRRPSLLQARKSDPIRDATPAPRLTFDQGLVGPIAGRERRMIRYRVVRLLDTPDELRGTEIGYLDQGDEVQLIEKYGAYWLVLTPTGQQGWLHKMTLGDIVDDDAGAPADHPTATMPIDADTWTMGDSDIDSDVLEAYLASRRRND